MSLTTRPGTGEARVLACLAKCSGEGLTLAQLCERLSRTPSTVRVSLKKLLQEGSVVREVGQSEHDITWRLRPLSERIAETIVSVQPMPDNVFNDLREALGDGGIVFHCDSFTGQRRQEKP